jgi:hypothetical protein
LRMLRYVAAVGTVSFAFAALRRKPAWLLVYFAVFVIFYGLRLWVCSPLLAMAEQGSTFYIRLRGAVKYVILIPTVLFFMLGGTKTIRASSGLHHGRRGRAESRDEVPIESVVASGLGHTLSTA